MGLYDNALNDGQQGAVGFKGTTLMTAAGGAYTSEGPWSTIVPLANTTFTTLTDVSRNGAAITGVTFPEGIPIPGDITEVEIATGGPVIGYKQ